MAEKFDPTPHLRWAKNFPHSPAVLEVGFRPINGGPVQWQQVPTVVKFPNREDEPAQTAKEIPHGK